MSNFERKIYELEKKHLGQDRRLASLHRLSVPVFRCNHFVGIHTLVCCALHLEFRTLAGPYDFFPTMVKGS